MSEKERDYKPQTAPGTISMFTNSSLHEDYVNELDIRIRGLRDLLEVSEKLMESDSHEMMRGGVKFARQIKEIFKDLLNNAESDIREKEQEDDS